MPPDERRARLSAYNRKWREAHPEQWHSISKRYLATYVRPPLTLEAETKGKETKLKWNLENKERIRESLRLRKLADPERFREYNRAYRARNVEKERERAQKKNWAKLGNPQPTRPRPLTCECCGGTNWRSLALDHCHKTGIFRGWLCDKCNLAIGKLGDTIEAVQKVMDYLKRSQQ